MKTKTEQLDLLFKEWEIKRKDYQGIFIKDGIIEETIFNKTSPKLLFIAKEANHSNEPKPGDFREWWKSEVKYKFTYSITEWSWGILNNFPPLGVISDYVLSK